MTVITVYDYVKNFIKRRQKKHPPVFVLGVIKSKSKEGLSVLKVKDLNSDVCFKVVKLGKWFKEGVYVVKIKDGKLLEAVKPDGILSLWKEALTVRATKLLLEGIQREAKSYNGVL